MVGRVPTRWGMVGTGRGVRVGRRIEHRLGRRAGTGVAGAGIRGRAVEARTRHGGTERPEDSSVRWSGDGPVTGAGPVWRWTVPERFFLVGRVIHRRNSRCEGRPDQMARARDSLGRDAAEEPTDLRSIEPRAPMVARRDLEAIVPGRDAVGQERATAGAGPGTDRGRVSNSVPGSHATAGKRWLK